MFDFARVCCVLAIAWVMASVGSARALGDRSDMRTQSRGLPIEGADSSIVQPTVTGPQFHPDELFLGVEDYYNPRLKRLREEYRLDEVVAGEKDEFRKLLKLRHWVHTRWRIDNDQNFSGDAFAILEKAKTGAGFHCAHSMVVQQAVMTAMGFVARNLGVDRNHEDLGRSAHHGVNEVWSNEYAKWVVLDAKYDVHFERDGVPLSALELHEAVRADGGRGIVKVKGVERRVVPMEETGTTEGAVRSYWWVAYRQRQNTFTQPHWSGGSRMVVLDNEAFRSGTWYRNVGKDLVKHWAYAANAFIPTRDRHQIEWTPGVPDVQARQVAPGELDVRVRSATPNFKAYWIRVNGGAWSAADVPVRWRLKPGENVLQVHARNLFDVDGPTVTATVTFTPPTKTDG